MDEKKEEALPCMYYKSRTCKQGDCNAYHKKEIRLPIVDIDGEQPVTHCLILAMKGVEIEEFNVFTRNNRNAIRGLAKEFQREKDNG